MTATQTKNIPQAIAFVDSQRGKARNYAERLFAAYRDAGTPRATVAPNPYTYGISSAVATKIDNMLRHLMVGDCTPNGRAL